MENTDLIFLLALGLLVLGFVPALEPKLTRAAHLTAGAVGLIVALVVIVR